jgi:hypothetical protein
MDKRFEKCLANKYLWIAHNYMKKCLALLVLRDVNWNHEDTIITKAWKIKDKQQSTNKVKYVNSESTNKTKQDKTTSPQQPKPTDNPKYWWGSQQVGFSYPAGGNAK